MTDLGSEPEDASLLTTAEKAWRKLRQTQFDSASEESTYIRIWCETHLEGVLALAHRLEQENEALVKSWGRSDASWLARVEKADQERDEATKRVADHSRQLQIIEARLIRFLPVVEAARLIPAKILSAWQSYLSGGGRVHEWTSYLEAMLREEITRLDALDAGETP